MPRSLRSLGMTKRRRSFGMTKRRRSLGMTRGVPRDADQARFRTAIAAPMTAIRAKANHWIA